MPLLVPTGVGAIIATWDGVGIIHTATISIITVITDTGDKEGQWVFQAFKNILFQLIRE
jgi:hypothetical protein